MEGIQRLSVAVIRQAFLDLSSRNDQLRIPAKKFINSQDFEFWTAILNLDPDMLREKAMFGDEIGEFFATDIEEEGDHELF